ncbi:hypothetical protein K461DRAFT_266638 [Myriangium duriaei CBS 260.36]|uniref:Nucleoporin Pom152 n=1 Tax=Myriangium duriaei CBS 260.36 TaxID=1168546 RepID=A0A9P4MHY5_9PEZI|nr:hypothetical protein K461DRAFT_266638 [Myriangium duriaei CBS 260.36]
MNGTPRLSSRFPETPKTSRQPARTPRSNESRIRPHLPDVPSLSKTANDGPLIPLDTVDAPQQRLLVVSFYVALFAWRLYDFHNLVEEDTESLWLFMKWVVIDGAFLFGLPELRIPWLEYSSNVVALLFLSHACLDGVLMFRIPIPLGAALMGLLRLVYDREVTISGSKVKYSNVIHDSSLLLGRQTIKILPEGSATLNPGRDRFCLGGTTSHVYLPIRINQTEPISMNLVRYDLDTNHNETTTFSGAQIKKLLREAKKNGQQSGVDGLQTIRVQVKKAGQYKLGRVVDKTGLEVRRRIAGDTFVVHCPSAIIKPLSKDKCRGELSNVELEVTGTPPLRVRYRKSINTVQQEAQLQSIQPDDLVSPLSQSDSSAIVPAGRVDATWARAQTVTVPLGESLSTSGDWAFSLDEVEDALGNKITYSSRDHDKEERQHSHSPHLHQVIKVHERPTVVLNGCSPQRPLKVARHKTAALPIQLGSTGKGGVLDSPYRVEYLFTPESELSADGDHSSQPRIEGLSIRANKDRPNIQDAGLYTLRSVATDFCSGEVLEPASCLLQNPPEPSLQIEHHEISDKCAQKAVGLRVDFHLTGTPPFQIQCRMTRGGANQAEVKFFDINGLRGQVDLTPPAAGHYTYEFVDISDATYKAHSLRDQNLILEQDVKPSAHASFISNIERKVCIDQSVKFGVGLRGEGPFTVEYELVQGSHRKPYKIAGITNEAFEIETEPLTKGGDYTLSLSSVTDGMGCKEALGQEAKINVRHQRPKAGFGLIEGSRNVQTLEHKKVSLPLKLTGEGPWTVEYHKVGQPQQRMRHQVSQPNAKIDVTGDGTFELLSMHDAICPGIVDSKASTISIDWIPRPELKLANSAFEKVSGNTYFKHDICEGEDDSVDLHLSGSAPFEVKYQENIKPDNGAKALMSKTLNTAGGTSSIRMDTAQAGVIEYHFAELSDYNYDHSKTHFTPTIIQQRVNPRPSARFTNPGKTYSYCTSLSSKVETIPIKLTGTPPFSIDYEVRHSGKTTPRIHSVSDISSHTYNIQIPASDLTAGTSAVFLRKVTDARTCTRTLPSTEPRVQISVHAAPSITPLETKRDYCVGDRLGYSLSGVAPFSIYYSFDGKARKATSSSTTFRRLAEKAGKFEITAVSDSGSGCKADVNLAATVHGLPSARVSDGREAEQDIHEGGSAEIEFRFGGEAPWEFTWVRSKIAGKGKRGEVMEMRSETSESDTFRLRAGEEGVYEVVRVRDRWCEVRREGVEVGKEEARKRLTN